MKKRGPTEGSPPEGHAEPIEKEKQLQRSKLPPGSGSGKGTPTSPSERLGISWCADVNKSISFVKHIDTFGRQYLAGVSARPGYTANGTSAVPILWNDLWGQRLVI